MNYFAYPGMPTMWRKKTVSEKDIINKITKHYDLTIEQLKIQSRKTSIVECRHICFYLIKQQVIRSTYVSIGEIFDRDRTTVMHGIKSIQNRYDSDPNFRLHIMEFEESIYYN